MRSEEDVSGVEEVDVDDVLEFCTLSLHLYDRGPLDYLDHDDNIVCMVPYTRRCTDESVHSFVALRARAVSTRILSDNPSPLRSTPVCATHPECLRPRWPLAAASRVQSFHLRCQSTGKSSRKRGVSEKPRVPQKDCSREIL